MAKNVSLLGANYPDVPAVQLPQTGGGTAIFYDIDPSNIGKITNLISGEQADVTTSFAYTNKSFTLNKPAVVRVDIGYNDSRPVALGVKAGTGQYNQLYGFAYVDDNAVSSSATGLSLTTLLSAGTYYIWAQALGTGKDNITVQIMTFS